MIWTTWQRIRAKSVQVISLLKVHPKLESPATSKSSPMLFRLDVDGPTNRSCFVATYSSWFITCCRCFALKWKKNADCLSAQRGRSPFNPDCICSLLFTGLIYLRGCLAEVNEVVLSPLPHLLTSLFASATSSRSRGHHSVPRRRRLMN